MIRSALHFLSHLAGDDPDRWRRLLAVNYLTYACRFRCPYCSDGTGTPYHGLDPSVLPAPKALDVLARIRRSAESVVLTGGEPLEHPGFAEVVRGIRRLEFDRVLLTTNGLDLDRHLDDVLAAVTSLIVSVDTLDREKADAWSAQGPGTLDRILENLDLAAERKPLVEIVVSSVMTPDNLDDLPAVCDHAWARGFTIAACPQLVGMKAHAALAEDPRYGRFYDFLVREKRRGRPVFGTVPYLEAMRDLRHFRCRPFTMLTVSQLGTVFYPCLERGGDAGNLLAEPSLHRIRREARRRFGPRPRCDTRCHSACALSFASLLENPWSILGELRLQAKRPPRGTGRVIRR